MTRAVIPFASAELGNVSLACKVMGFSCDTFYRYQSAMEVGGVDALIEANRRKLNQMNLKLTTASVKPGDCQIGSRLLQLRQN